MRSGRIWQAWSQELGFYVKCYGNHMGLASRQEKAFTFILEIICLITG